MQEMTRSNDRPIAGSITVIAIILILLPLVKVILARFRKKATA